MRSSVNYLLLTLSTLSVLPPSASAQSIQLPGITVQGATLDPRPIARAAGVPTTAEAPPPLIEASAADVSGIPREQIGTAVTVVTGDELRAQQVRYIADALRSLPGVSVSRAGGPANLSQVRIRGAEANHTLVLIDGIEANATSDGDFDFATLLTDDIERIEVLRGPQSGLYGSKAVGGVINIITKSGKGPLTATVRGESGAYGTADVAARIAGGSDRAWFAASLQRRSSHYFNNAAIGSEEDPWRNLTLSLKGGVVLLPGVTLDFTLRNVDRKIQFDLDESPSPGALTRQTDSDNVSNSGTFLGGVNLRWDMLGGALSHVLSASRNVTEVESRTSGLFGGFSDNLSEIDRVSYLTTWRFATPELLAASHALSAQLEQKVERFTPGPFTPGEFGPDGIERERGQIAAVGEYRGAFANRVFFTGSLRHDDNDTFQDFTTWRAAVSMPWPELAIRPHASIGTGVALPGMFEQFGSILGVFVPNPNLKPEQSLGWDAGVEFTLVKDRAFLDVTYFRANLEDEIIFDDTGLSLTNREGTSKRQGVEFELRTKLLPWLLVGASYTYLDASEPDGREEIRRPRHAGRADVTYLFGAGRGTFNLAAIYNGSMRDRNFGPFPAAIVTLDDYWLISSALTYKLQNGVEVFGRVENLLDSKYEEISGYNSPGIAALAGVKLTFGGPDGLAWAK
jgi:vitamin B12 transporter